MAAATELINRRTNGELCSRHARIVKDRAPELLTDVKKRKRVLLNYVKHHFLEYVDETLEALIDPVDQQSEMAPIMVTKQLTVALGRDLTMWERDYNLLMDETNILRFSVPNIPKVPIPDDNATAMALVTLTNAIALDIKEKNVIDLTNSDDEVDDADTEILNTVSPESDDESSPGSIVDFIDDDFITPPVMKRRKSVCTPCILEFK